MRALSMLIACLVGSCGGDPRPQDRAPSASIHAEPAAPTPAPIPTSPDPATAETAAEPPAADPFAEPMPETSCPDRVRVAIAHRASPDLPTLLESATAFRSEDGRRLRLVVANHPLARDALGRFIAPGEGQARFEMDVTRTRRGPLVPRVLGTPESRSGGLTHARLVTPGPLLTFSHRDIGQVEITEVTERYVCGRIDLNDGFGRVRGAFRAEFEGDLP